MAMFRIDDRQIQALENDLKTFASRALPFATRNTLNQAAFTAQRFAREGVKDSMINRNRFTVQSIQVEQARMLLISRQSSTVGSTADYMEDQEFGATKTKSGREGVSIATSYSSGEGMNTKPRTRLSKKPNKLANIQLRRKRKRGSSRKQQNAATIREAATSNRKFIFLDLGKRKGIFRVVGGKRQPKIRMVHDMTSQTVVIPRNPWLKPAFDQTVQWIPSLYADSLRFQLKRFNLFK